MPNIPTIHAATRSPVRSPLTRRWASPAVVASQTIHFGADTLASAGGAKAIASDNTEVDFISVTNQGGATRTWSVSGGRLIANGTPGVDNGRVLTCSTSLGTIQVTISTIANAYSVASTTQMQAVIDLSSGTLAGKTMYIRPGTYNTIDDLTFTNKMLTLSSQFTIKPHGADLSVSLTGWWFRFSGVPVLGTDWLGDTKFEGIKFYRDISWWASNSPALGSTLGAGSNINYDSAAWLVGTSGTWARNLTFDRCEFASNMQPARFGDTPPAFPNAISIGAGSGGVCDTMSITNCTVHNLGSLTTVLGPDWTVQNNTAYYMFNDFIRINTSTSGSYPTENFLIKDNTFSESVDNAWIYHGDFLQTFGSGGFDIGPGKIQGNIIFPGYEGVRRFSGGTATIFDGGAVGALLDPNTAAKTFVSGDNGKAFYAREFPSGSDYTLTLPLASGVSTGWKVSVTRQRNMSTRAISIVRQGSDTINGGSSPISLPDMWDSVTVEKTGASAFTATMNEVLGGPVVKSSNFSIASTDTNKVFFVDASSGPITVTLPSCAASSGNSWAVQKIDTTSNVVTLDLNGSDTHTGRIAAPAENPTLGVIGRGVEFTSPGTSVWTEAYLQPSLIPMIFQQMDGGGQYKDIEVSGNILWAQGTISCQLDPSQITNFNIFNNSLIQFIPGDVDGDGKANKYSEGFDTSVGPIIYSFGDNLSSTYKNLANSVVSWSSAPALMYDNETSLENSDLSTFTALLNGNNTATDFFPLTRAEAISMARPRSAGNAFYGAVGTTDTNGFYNFSTKAVNTLPAPTINSYDPVDNATLVPGNKVIVALFDQPIKAGTGNITLRKNDGGWADVETFNVATGVGSAGGTVTIVGRTVTITPGANMTATKEHAIRIASTCIDSRVYGTDFAGIADDTTWSFTATTPTADNLLTNPGVMTTAPWSNVGGDSITDSGTTFATTGEKWYRIAGTANLRYDTDSGSDPFSPAGSTTYTYSVYIKRDGVTVTHNISVQTLGGTNSTSTIALNTGTGSFTPTAGGAHGSTTLDVTSLGSEEYRVRLTITTPSGTNRLLIQHTGSGNVLASSALLTEGSTLETYVP